ncbi:MAG: methyltransferase domain-containing protein [Hyphomicrobiaceae bacterium]
MLKKPLKRMRNRIRSAKVHGWKARQFRTAARQSRKLHLACGPVVRQSWTNVDIEARPGVLDWDLRRALPLDAGSIDIVYAEHFIEHITLDEGEALMCECQRALTLGGVVRLSTPDLAFLIEEYRAQRLTEWEDMGWLPQSGARMVNEGMRMWGHQFLYDEPELHAMLRRAGFVVVRNCSWRESTIPALVGAESRPFHNELIVEAVKA